MFAGKARIGSSLTLKKLDRLVKLGREKQSSLFGLFINYARKMFAGEARSLP